MPKATLPPDADAERDFRVLAVFTLLRVEDYSREAAMDKIADLMSCEPETVRSIIRKYSRYLPFR